MDRAREFRGSKRFVHITAVALVSLTFTVNIVIAQTKGEIDPQLRQKTFDVVWRTINEKYFDPESGGVDWAKMHEKYEPQVAAR
jgi:tellurite resistance protein